MILAIETSSVLCSIVFWEEGEVLQAYNHKAPMQHATLIGQRVEKGIKQTSPKEIKAVAVAIGPGSFTGLRIGLSYAQGFCFGRSLPIYGISNHQILARQALNTTGTIYSLIDARRNEIYLAEHQSDDLFHIKSHEIVTFDDLADRVTPNSRMVVHEDVKLADQVKNNLLKKNIELKTNSGYDAALIAQLADQRIKNGTADDVEKLEPMYIRPFAGAQ